MPENILQPSEDLMKLYVQTGSNRMSESVAATENFAIALAEPLRQAVMLGDVVTDIYQKVALAPTAMPEFELDPIAPGTEHQYAAFTLNGHGYVPERHIEGDYIMVPTFEIGAGIDWLLRYARNSRFDVMQRAVEVFKMGFTKKINDDGWHTLLASVVDRNIIVNDSDAAQGQFTKRLVTLLKTVMRRNGGGNSSSVNRGKLTHVYCSPEALDDMRNWGVDLIDEVTRRELYLADDGTFSRVFGVLLRDLDELGVGQEYQNFYTATLGGALAASDDELVIGLDLSKNDSFYMPVRRELEMTPDELMHRKGRAGLYGSMELGFAVMDNRRVVAGSF